MPGEMKLKPCLSEEDIRELSECILCVEWRGARELGVYIAAFLKEAAEGQAAPEPGTSVIRWTRYDGTPGKLPDEGEPIFLKLKNMHILISARFDDAWDRVGVEIRIGDKWAYLPGPPEVME